MEQLHAKRDSWLTWSLFVCLVLALSMSLTACGKKSKSGSVGTSPDTDSSANPSCTDCAGYSDELAAGLNQSTTYHGSNLQMSLVVFAPDSNASNNGAYSGAVHVRGHLSVKANYSYAGCVIPKGEYTVASTQVGQYSNQSVMNLNSVTAKIKNLNGGKEFDLYLAALEFDQPVSVASIRSFKEGSKTYKYPLSFWGQTYLCGSGNNSVFFTKE